MGGKTLYLDMLLISLLVFTVYFNVLDNEFVYDDKYFIEGNFEIRDLTNIPNFFVNAAMRVYRPIRTTFYALNYAVWKLNPFGYHLFSVIIHLLCTILIYFVVDFIAKKRIISLMASLLFAVHPVHTEMIAFIAGGFDAIGVLFLLLSFLCYLKSSSEKGIKKKAYIFSLLFFMLGVFTHEAVLTLIGILILYDFSLKERINIASIKKKILHYTPYFFIAAFYLFVRTLIISFNVREFYPSAMIALHYKLLTALKILSYYIKIAVLPVNLVVDRGFFPIQKFGLEAIFYLVIAIALLILLIYLYRKNTGNSRILFFCIAGFIIAITPYLNMVPIGHWISDEHLYLPSLFFCLLLAFFLYKLFKFGKWRYAGIAVFSILIILYSIKTIDRNDVWQDSYTLWLKTIEQSPQSAVAHTNLGIVYHNQGKINLAINEYEKALTINPNYALAYNSLGAAYYDLGEIDLAIEEYKKALAVNPNYPEAHNNLGTAYEKQGKIELAIEEYKKAIAINQINVEFYNNLGLIYQSQGRLDLAIKEYKKALAIDPNYAEAHNNLGAVYQNQGQIELAIEEYRKAIAIDPSYAEAHNNLGMIYKLLGQIELAIREYKEAIRLNPEFAEAYYNLGNVYFDEGDMDLAIGEYEKVIAINQDMGEAHNNLGLAYYSQGKIESAIEEYEKALAINPDHVKARENLEAALT